MTSITILNDSCTIYASATTLGVAGTTTIYGYANSIAKIYAGMYDYTFVALTDEHDHVYDSGVVTQKATATAEGVMTYTCTQCSHSYTTAIPKLDVVLGDADGDDRVTLKDVTTLFQYVNGQITADGVPDLTAGDVDGDGQVTLKDVTKLFQYVNGQISSLD